MTRIVILIGLMACGHIARAETRGILIEVTSLREVRPGLTEYAAPHINVYSQEPQEMKENLSVADAANILKQARGWKSSVLVEIVFHDDFIKPEDLITLLEGMKGNSELMLFYVGPADHGSGKQELERFKQLKERKT